MRDYQEVIIKFVKIVERYPQLYDSSHPMYRTRYAELAWDKIAECIRTELDEDCSVDEIKMKWKGIRSSYNRFKNKLNKTGFDTAPCKKYYLYDSLNFLAPYTKNKTNSKDSRDDLQGKSTTEEGVNSDDDEDDSGRDDFASDMMKHWEVTIKSEAEDEDENILSTDDVLSLNLEEINNHNIDLNKEVTKLASVINSMPDVPVRKRRYETAIDTNTTESEDLQFFKSILPDIKDFSVKEKRTLKMGILKLIDEIEDSRQQVGPAHEVSSSKIKRL